MTRQRLLVLPITLTIACGSTASPLEPKAPTVAPSASAAESSAEPEALDAVDAPTTLGTRRLGDYFVYRYSGGFSEAPLTLTEQVVAEEFGLLVVDFVLEQSEAMDALRVRMSPAGRVVSVARLGSEGEVPAEIGDYEAMMNRTQLVPERNEEFLGEADSTCLIGEAEELDCTTSRYLVQVGAADAVLSVTKSAAVPGRDLGGEILGADGDVLYRAELVDRGNEAPGADAVAWAGKTLRYSPPEP